MGEAGQRLDNLLTERRVFPPSAEFAAQANAAAALYEEIAGPARWGSGGHPAPMIPEAMFACARLGMPHSEAP